MTTAKRKSSTDVVLTVEQAVERIGGRRFKVKCLEPTLFGAHPKVLPWSKFAKALERSEKIVESWEHQEEYPVAVLESGIWKLYGKSWS